MHMDIRPPEVITVPTRGMLTLTHVLYGMHAFSAVMGMLGPMFIVTAFLTGWPSIIAVIVNYVKRSDMRGTYLHSHFRWQIRTFWYALLWALVCVVLFITLVGIVIAWPLAMIVGIWVLYRLGRGWTTLLDGRPMPVEEEMEKL